MPTDRHAGMLADLSACWLARSCTRHPAKPGHALHAPSRQAWACIARAIPPTLGMHCMRHPAKPGHTFRMA
eukprot:364069-Chlamydomonas_euryale.AAC.4